MTPKYWMGLQSDYDLDLAEDVIAEKIRNEIEPCEKCMA
jgi:plasmid maintenance system antidote protein VapI